MEIRSRNLTHVTVLDLTGRLDSSSAAALTTWVENHIAASSAPCLVINLAAVNFIDSTGLSSLVRGMKRCREKQGDLNLCGLQSTVRIIFELTRLDKAFDIFMKEEDAVRSLERKIGA